LLGREPSKPEATRLTDQVARAAIRTQFADPFLGQRSALAQVSSRLAEQMAGLRPNSQALAALAQATRLADLGTQIAGAFADLDWPVGSPGTIPVAVLADLEEQRTESGLILPSAAETWVFGVGGVKIDVERAFWTLVFSGLLLPVIMSPYLAPVREFASWAVWLMPMIYVVQGRKPKD
jgi:hypothetical protein